MARALKVQAVLLWIVEAITVRTAPCASAPRPAIFVNPARRSGSLTRWHFNSLAGADSSGAFSGSELSGGWT